MNKVEEKKVMTVMRYRRRPNDFFTNQLINQLFRETQDSFKNVMERENNFRPASNIVEEEDYYLLEMSIPGFSKQEVNIQLEDDKLKISATKEDKNKDRKYLRREFGNQSFERSFKLSDSINREVVSAEVRDGILNVILPKIQKEEKKVQNIEIK